MRQADIIVLGGGIIGCALAEELARHGRRVILIERGRIGQEASVAAAGILAAQMDLIKPGPLLELCQASRRMYPGWVAHLERRSRLSLDYASNGLLYLVTSKRHERQLAHRARWQRRLGLRVERWSRRELARREPTVDGAVRSGFHFPTEARVKNDALMQALARACRRAGVVVREQTTVHRVLLRRRAVRGVTTNRGGYAADVVVNCLGSWAAMHGRFPVRLPVEPVRGQILAFRARKTLLRRTILSAGGYAVQQGDGRVLIGSTLEWSGFEKIVTIEGIRRILRGIRRMSDVLTHCVFEEAWVGLRPYVQDRLPLIGKTSIEGLYVATGHFRHGILLAPVTAALMTELLLQGCTSLDVAPFSPTRF